MSKNINVPKKTLWTTMVEQKNDIRSSWTTAKLPTIIFAVLVFAVLLVPFVGMLWAPTTSTTENRTLAEAPQLFNEDGSFNINILEDAGTYFEDHFAYRNNLVDADANLYAMLFGESVTNQVVLGKEGWLFYAGTINNYQNTDTYTERQANNIAHNLSLLQTYCEAQGSQFVFTIAPNKVSLYSEFMTDLYPKRNNNSMDILAGYLEKYNVNYLNAFAMLENDKAASNEPLYFLGDSHWNDKTAAKVADSLASAVGLTTLGLADSDFAAVDDYTGDLAKMLYPLSASTETNYYVQGINDGSGKGNEFRSGSNWTYIEGETTEDSTIQTVSTVADASNTSLLMYRDSFANNLVPFMATQYGSATFSKLVPYNALTVAENRPSVVVVERAERHTDYLAQKAFIMPAPEITTALPVGEAKNLSATCKQSTNGPLLYLEGVIEGATDEYAVDAKILLRVTGLSGSSKTYEACNISTDESDWSFGAYMYQSEWAGQIIKVEVFLSDSAKTNLVDTFTFTIA